MGLLDFFKSALLSPIPERETVEARKSRFLNPGGEIGGEIQRQIPQDQTASLEETIRTGLQSSPFSASPLSTMSAQLAQAGSQLPKTVDPLLPTIVALMESRGLLDPKPRLANNPYNIMTGGLVNYPSPEVAILGGGPRNQLGLLGLLREGGLYQDFRESGNLADFFRRFTPRSDPLNPSTEELLARYQSLRELFD